MTTRKRPSTKPPSRSQKRMKHVLVLVVDDERDNREMYMEYLRHVGFAIAGAASGEEAITKARELRPALILMDLSLPGIDGWDATAILKSDPSTREIPILCLTSHVEPEDRDRALAVGCDLFVSKPALPVAVAEQIRALLDRDLAASSR